MARDKLKKKIATYHEGVAVRKQEVEQARVAMAKDEAELSKLQNEEKILKRLVEQLKGIVLSCHVMSYFYDIIIIIPRFLGLQVIYLWFYLVKTRCVVLIKSIGILYIF